MNFTKRIFILWRCVATPAFSSPHMFEASHGEVLAGESYFPKSLARCQAALLREYDFMTYLNGLKSTLESPTCALADLKRAHKIKEMLHKMRAVQESCPEAGPAVAMPLTASSAWPAPPPHGRKKTHGVAHPARALQRNQQEALPSSSVQDIVPQAFRGSLVKDLEAFWASKAGLRYHEVATLFKAIGGRISEKRGGSSHVTLSYPMSDGGKLKHELWRPHGSGNTFGFRTMANLHLCFERSGFKRDR